MAALNLNRTQLADILRVPRSTLYAWFDGKEPHAAIVQRLTKLARLLENAGVSAADSISPRFVRQSLGEGEPSLLDLLKADTLDEVRVATVLVRAKELETEAKRTRMAREDQLRNLGFFELTAAQCKENLALNVALREWPKE
jgi:predicted transcriptional regulator